MRAKTACSGSTLRARLLGRSRSPAFVLLDAMMALFVLGALLTMMAYGMTSHRRIAASLADTRAACDSAESALIDLQRGKPVIPADGLKIDHIAGAAAVPDHTWIRVTATVHGHAASLTGLVQSGSLKGN